MTPPRRPSHGLGPHAVGTRVVVRRVLPGETGPSGGPAMTDVLGDLVSWDDDGDVVVLDADGRRHRFAAALVVSGKPVPPRPSPRLRIPVPALHDLARRALPAEEEEPLGAWVLRHSPDDPVERRRVARRTSVLAVGEPDRPLAEAVEVVERWYADRGRAPWVCAPLGSPVERLLTDRGWTTVREGEADTELWVGSVAQARRRLPDAESVALEVEGRSATACVRDEQGDTEDGVLGRGRCALDASGDTVGLLGLWVAPEARRRGVARRLLAALLDHAAAAGATTGWLQVIGDNEPATTLYTALGWQRHHAYRYLAPPASSPDAR